MVRLADIESLIVSGQNRRAIQQLKAIQVKDIPRKELAYFASLCRRSNLQLLAIKFLNPFVRPVGKKNMVASPQEKAEYAACLTYLGATEEADKLLHEIDAKEVPQSLLFQAFCYFATWDYESAIPVLEQYVKTPSLTDYQILIGKVNWVAALVYERKHNEAYPLLKELIGITQKQNLYLLQGNLWEISAQNEIFQKKWSVAESHLHRSASILEKNVGGAHVYVDKWQAISELMKLRNKKSRMKLSEFKRVAQRESLWEVVRDCERYEAIIFHETELMNKVCSGTPYPKFLEKSLSLWGPGYSLPEFYWWTLEEGKKISDFDLVEGREYGKPNSLKVGLGLHRLLVSLCSDFYRPLRIAVLHHRIFPEEFYNPISSPKRVHEKIRFLRKWLKKNKTPLAVEQRKKFYYLKALLPVRIKVKGQTKLEAKLPLELIRLKENLPNTFTSSQVSKKLSISPRSAVRLVQKGIETQFLVSFGKGRSSRYRWAK